MIAFNINHTDYTTLLQDFANAFDIPYSEDDFIMVPPSAGEGCIKILKLYDELQVMLADVSFKQALLTTREHSDKRYFILDFDDVYIKKQLSLK